MNAQARAIAAVRLILADTIAEDRPATRDMPKVAAGRGEAAIEIFGRPGDFDEKAASLIADLLSAVHLRGLNPRATLEQAVAEAEGRLR